MPRRLLASVTSFAALVAIGLTGCAGSTDPLTSVSTAVDTSLSHAFNARVKLTGAEALGAKPKGELLGAGTFDVGRGLGYERVDLPGPLDQAKRPPRDYLVFLRDKIFLAPAAQSALPEGKSVISVPLTGAGAAAAGANRFVAQAMGLNPVLLLDEIAAGGTAATKTGSELVQHVHFTDYRVTVNLRRALSRVHGPFARAERIAIRQQLAALGPGRAVVEIDVRTDSAGFVRGLDTTIPGAKLGKVALEPAWLRHDVRAELPDGCAARLAIRAGRRVGMEPALAVGARGLGDSEFTCDRPSCSLKPGLVLRYGDRMGWVRRHSKGAVILGVCVLALAGAVTAVIAVGASGGDGSTAATTGAYAPIKVSRPKIRLIGGGISGDVEGGVVTYLSTLMTQLPGHNHYGITLTNTSSLGFIDSLEWYPPTGVRILGVTDGSAGRCRLTGVAGIGGNQFSTAVLYPNIMCQRVEPEASELHLPERRRLGDVRVRHRPRYGCLRSCEDHLGEARVRSRPVLLQLGDHAATALAIARMSKRREQDRYGRLRRDRRCFVPRLLLADAGAAERTRAA